MKNYFLVFILTLLTIVAFSQRKVTGIILCEGNGLMGAKIQEIGTNNFTFSNQDGKFTLITIENLCKLSFSFVALETKTIEINNDTTLNLTLEVYKYESRWITFGASYDAINSTIGCTVSNGLEENPLIHFEDFSDDWMFKVSGSTDFKKDYSIETKMTYKHFSIIPNMPSIEYIRTDYSSKKYKLSDLNLSFGIWMKFIQSNLNLKFGHQGINDNSNLGSEIGLQKSFYHAKTYCGFMVGYWFEYYTYRIYFQSFIFENKLSFRANYERVDKFDFLTVGLNYTFRRK